LKLEHLLVIFILSLFDLHGLEEQSTKVTHCLTSKEMFFGWQDISDEYLVCFFALIVGEIAEEKIVV